MAYQIISTTFDIFCNSDCPRTSSDDVCSYHPRWERLPEALQEGIEKLAETAKVYDIALKVVQLKKTRQGNRETLTTLFPPGLHTPRKSNPQTPSTLSPASSPSAPSSSASRNSTWDSPQTPYQASDQVDYGLPTPLTAPFSREQAPKATSSSKKNLQSTPTRSRTNKSKHNISWDDDDVEKSPRKVRSFASMLKSFPIKDTSRPSASSLHNSSSIKIETEDDVFGGTSEDLPSDIDATVVPRAISHKVTRYEKKGLRKILEHILPFELRARLSQTPNKCVATQVRAKGSCPWKRRGSLSMVEMHLAHIRLCVDNNDYFALPGHIENLVKVVTCTRHQKVALADDIRQPRMQALRDLMVDLPHQHMETVTGLGEWLKAISNDTEPASAPGLTSSLRLHMNWNSGSTTSSSTGDTVAFQTSKFIPYRATQSSALAITMALKSQIIAPLTKHDRKYGFIYMFWNQQSFGMIKIGRTNNLTRRLAEWNRQCKIDHQYCQQGVFQEIPHVPRIERLMHAELINYRRTSECDGCGRNHKEWFDIDEAKARKVYQKWHNWIVQKPYARDQNGNWTIRAEMRASVAEVCTPVNLSDTSVEKPSRR
ncbi:hypothetical protein OPT61_g5739 [Boeremia exigua]|uniref:Uncharacterized protein n=1 Tax=Boeremia exigua TaxID=749465 RepID=A0ACC2I975_9PLEO|nr:hypothetical protein OPT61_g5739 [Boeremia exigua]